MKNIKDFGYGGAAYGLKKTPFFAFSQFAYTAIKYYNFFSGGITALNSLSFPNSDDQILSIEEIGFDYGNHTANTSDFFQILKNDKVIFRCPIWELVSKDVIARIATITLKDFGVKFKRLKNPIIVNGTDNIKIQGYLSGGTSFTTYIRGTKYSKSYPFVYNERNGKTVERNDFTLYHQKTVATGSNIIFSNETNDLLISKNLPLSNRESFVVNAIEVLDLALALATDAEVSTAGGESINLTNELRLILNNTEVLKVSDLGLFSYIHKSATSDFIESKYGTLILPEPIIIPASSSVQVLFNSVARTKASTTLLFMLKGELLTEV